MPIVGMADWHYLLRSLAYSPAAYNFQSAFVLAVIRMPVLLEGRINLLKVI